MQSLINLTENNDNEKLKKENEEYKKKLTEKDKEITDLKNKLKTFSEEKTSTIIEKKESKEEKEEKEIKKSTNEEINNISKEQTEKEEERKKTKKKTKKKKKKKKEDTKDEEINEENKEEMSKQTEIIEEKKDKEIEKDKENQEIIEEKKDEEKDKEKENKEIIEEKKEVVEEKKEIIEEKKEVTEETKENIEENKDIIPEERKENTGFEERNIINGKEKTIRNEQEEKEEEKKEEKKEEETEPNYKIEYFRIKNLLVEYEQGNIISQKTKNDIDLLKTESLSKINELRSKIEELNTNNLSKFKEYETLISSANIELSQKTRTIDEYESIALKQEDQIDKLNKRIYDLNEAIFHKDLSMKQNETYSNQLINIINEHKLQIKKMREQKLEEENQEISMLRRQNKNLKNELEIDQKIMQNMKLNHQNLQDKYLTICYKVKKKEQEDLIRQAKNLSKENLRKINSNKYGLHSMNRSSSLSMLGIKKFKIIKNRKKFNDVNIMKNNNELNLPEINIGNRSFENGNLNPVLLRETNDQNYEGDYKKNLDEINDKLKQIIDEN